MIKYVVWTRLNSRFWEKKNLWIVYTEEDGALSSGWAWTYNGACNEAELYIRKIQDGSHIK